MTVWITGGAGYIGSTIAHACRAYGITPVVIDDLSSGHHEATAHLPFYLGDFADLPLLRRIVADHGRPRVVVHTAGLVSAGASMAEPMAYYQTNVMKTLRLCEFLIEIGCPRLVVESSAAVYGDCTAPIVDEQAAALPVSPYAYSKYALERMLCDVAAVHQLQVVCLRLFNVVGFGDGLPRHRSSRDVLSQLQNADKHGEPFKIYGTDWPTVDGTALRDFVHVEDVARAHMSLITAADWRVHGTFDVLNVATGVGTTVRQLLGLYQSLRTAPVRLVETGRRPGDIAGFVGDPARARRLLGWSPTLTLSDAMSQHRRVPRADAAHLRASAASTVDSKR